MTMHEIKIPFPGFYCSELESMIDHEIESAFDYEGTGNAEIPDDFYIKMKYHGIFLAIAELYTEAFQDWLDNEAGIKIGLRFKDMVSPRYYNFETDRLFCEISDQDIMALWRIVDKDILEKLIKERFTSRDGFSSHYQNSLKNTGEDYKTAWPGNPKTWNHNQLETLLIAAVLSVFDKKEGLREERVYFEKYHAPDIYGLMESAACNGYIHNAVWDNVPQACIDMLNEYDAKARYKE